MHPMFFKVPRHLFKKPLTSSSTTWKKSFPMSFNIFFDAYGVPWCSFWHLCCSLASLVTPKENSMHPLTFNFPMPLPSPNTPCHTRKIHFHPFIHQNPLASPTIMLPSTLFFIHPCHPPLPFSPFPHHFPSFPTSFRHFPPLTKPNWNIPKPKHPISIEFFANDA